jgi:fatty acid desaturase
MNALKQWERDNKKQLQPPATAWPTIGLFIGAIFLFVSSSLLIIQSSIPLIVAIIANTCALFMLFTVLHDASHRSLSQNVRINEYLGSICAFLISPLAGIKVFRFIHMQHHRFTNEDRVNDPDAWCGKGSIWTLPLRWMSLDLHYVVWYLGKWRTRPKKEHAELILTISTTLVLFSLIIAKGWFFWLLTLWLIPSRISSTWLALAFDYLPHFPHDTKGRDNEYRATNLRLGFSGIMTPLFLSQNYHLIHHLYPRIPFYRYPRIWKMAQQELKDAGARILTWRGIEINKDPGHKDQ